MHIRHTIIQYYRLSAGDVEEEDAPYAPAGAEAEDAPSAPAGAEYLDCFMCLGDEDLDEDVPLDELISRPRPQRQDPNEDPDDRAPRR